MYEFTSTEISPGSTLLYSLVHNCRVVKLQILEKTMRLIYLL